DYLDNKKNLVSPLGRAMWARLAKPDTQYNSYSVDLILDPAMESEFCTEMESFYELAYERQLRALKVKSMPRNPAPWRTTGENELTFKFSAKAGGFHADGTSWTRKPIKLFDASGREFTPDETFMLGNDSVIKVHFRPGGYTAANKVGLKLY